MMYECVDCGYNTNKKFNFDKHKNRKTSCKRTTIPSDLNISFNNQILNSGNLHVSFNDPNTDSGNHKIHLCSKCQKTFSNSSNLKRHQKICKNVRNPLQCIKCQKIFSSYQSKHNHIKKVKCVPVSTDNSINPPITSNTTSINCNNTNMNITNNVHNIVFNSFGNENLTHLFHDKDLIYKTNIFSRKGVYGLVDIIDHIFLDPNHPENNTIVKFNERGDDVYIKNECNTWEYRDYEDIKGNFIESLSNFLRIYNTKKNEMNIKLVENKERLRIKEFIILLMTIGGIIDDDLAEELNVDDDYIVDEEKIQSKFDKATLSRLFFKSNVLFHKSDGKIKHKV